MLAKRLYINKTARVPILAIRQGKDAQKLYNYWKSASAEIIALQPKAPWTGVVGSLQTIRINGKPLILKNMPFFKYDLVYDENRAKSRALPTRAQPVQGSPAMMQSPMYARDDIRLAIGMPQENMGQNGDTLSVGNS